MAYINALSIAITGNGKTDRSKGYSLVGFYMYVEQSKY